MNPASLLLDRFLAQLYILLGGEQEVDHYAIWWHVEAKSGNIIPSAVYFFLLRTDGFKAVRKPVFVK